MEIHKDLVVGRYAELRKEQEETFDKLDKIINTLVDYFEYEIEGNSTYGFDVTTTINKDDTDKVIAELNKVLEG